MNRRQFLVTAAGAAAPLLAVPRSQMGVATTCYMTVWRPRDTFEFMEHCIALGAGGIQTSLPFNDAASIKKLRDGLEPLGMYLEVMIGLPCDDGSAFEKTVLAAKEAGALCVRTACLGGRRYETFATLADWKKFVEGARAGVTRGLAICEKHRMPFALENHKDWTVDEMAALMKEFSSEYLGVCLDTGNNISLLDDPMDVVERLAPYAISTHLKDMGVESYKDGFLLSEMPMGEGFLDLKRVVQVIRAARPKTRITLEMITRNPLQIPCLTEKYWETFPNRSGRYLARTLAMVAARQRKQPLPRIDHLPKDAQLRLEDDNVKQCLHYGREQLSL
ncbi:MAG: sugar phosphate isomerase/epimerase [Candidatus Solibacter usitatus]|nr:sugar phosphate isomerase/epimerase [Candidatus Solibacter usitatus]